MGRGMAMGLGAAVLLAGGVALGAPRTTAPAPSAAETLARTHRTGALLSLRLLSELNEARRIGDERVSRCLDGTLTEVHAALRLLWQRLDRLKKREPGQNGERIARQSVPVFEERLRTLDRDARACHTGERDALIPMGPSGVTRVEMTIAPGTPDEDPTGPLKKR